MLADLLQDEIATICELNELLHREYLALKKRDPIEIRKLTAEKQDRINRLQDLIELHTDVLKHSDRQNASMKTYLASAPIEERGQLAALWTKLWEAFSDMHRQNEINGAIISASRSHLERALTILCGRNPQDSLYCQSAQLTFDRGYSSLAKA